VTPGTGPDAAAGTAAAADAGTGAGAGPDAAGTAVTAAAAGPGADADAGPGGGAGGGGGGGAGVDPVVLLGWFEEMAVIRGTEKAAHDLFLAGLVKGTTHLAAGQEAVAVGASAGLRPGDYVFATYRGHHHAIARGATPEECLAELMSKATGVCGGKGGSMHLTKASAGMLGSYAIVGAHLPIAAGAAWSAQLRGSGQVAAAFFGDGATNIGAFHEALNLASVWSLPVLFICENNLYMEYTPIGSVTAADHPAASRAAAYRLPAEIIDGNDVTIVAAAVSRAAARARAGHGPTVIEALTYRHYGHSRTDPAAYRPPAEVTSWLARDPLDITARHLSALGVPPAAITAARDRAAATVTAAVTAAKAAPDADPAQALTDLWADGGHHWRT
jgi:acetoin:2,6-dichlorophenolindophenol oxidoreductase subunit alpha